ncbi:uncharacterized protein [Nicotiana tomentosiformis]|uniref:uncharacterized protein n=1 Tax=Nicotiana tomentosiformis TaxID=4098 RepID=UPI00388CDFB3
MDDDNDHEWMERFVVVATRDIIPATTPSFPESWTRTRKFNVCLFLDQGLFHAVTDLSFFTISATRWTPPSVEGLDHTAFVVTASQPTTPSVLSPSSPTMPSPPATATSSPPAADTREEDVPPSQSLVHGNLGHNYSPPSADPQRRRSVSLSISTECHLLSRPVKLTNYLKPPASEKDKNKIHSLLGECMINNAMHNAVAGLQKLILDKEKLTSEQDQLLTERDPIVTQLPALEAQAAEVVELEAQLQQIEQDMVTLGEEAVLLRVQLQETKAKWSEVQNDVLAISKHEAASTERLNNLEPALNSKAEEVAAAKEKHARMEEKYKRVMEHDKVYNSTICDLDVSLQAARSERNSLSTEVDQLKT